MSFGHEFRNVKVGDEGVQVLHDELAQFKSLEVEVNVSRLDTSLHELERANRPWLSGLWLFEP